VDDKPQQTEYEIIDNFMMGAKLFVERCCQKIKAFGIQWCPLVSQYIN